MKSAQLFWDQIALYHESTIFIQLLMIVIGIVLTVLLYARPAKLYNNLMKIYLAFSFAFQSFVFFWSFDQSPIGRFFAGPLFLIIAGLFLADVFFKKIEFTFPKTKWARVMLFVGLGLVLIGYPVISFLLGHRYPRLTTPFMPCPLTVFALSLLSAALPRIDLKVYSLLLVWAAMGLPKVFGLFDVREDTILFAAGVYALVMLIKNWQGVRHSDGSVKMPARR